VHSAQSIGILAGTMRPGQTSAAGSGISLINDKGPITAQAQAGEMRIASKDKLTLQSATQHIDFAAAKRITLTVAGGAQIVIDSSGVHSRCPGTITIHAAQRSFVGPAKADSALPTRPHSVVCESCMEKARQQASALAPRA
jgi:type VI secretion system secreted protein VgrG